MSEGAQRPRCLKLNNGRFIDVVKGRALGPGSSVLIYNGTILDVLEGPASGDRPPPDAVIDLKGLTVIPGLCNTHAHVAMPIPGTLLGLRESTLPKKHGRSQVETNLAQCLDLGITTVRDCLCENLKISQRLKSALELGELQGPRLHQAVLVGQEGGTFTEARSPAAKLVLPIVGLPALEYDDPTSGILSFPLGASEVAVRSAVDKAIDERGADCIKLYDQREKKLTYKPGATMMSIRQMEAIVDQARLRGVPTTLHQVTVESFRRGVRAGVTSLAHMPIDDALTPADIRAFRDAGCLLEPTATLAYFYSFDLDDEPSHPRLARLRRLRSETHRRRIEAHWIPELQPLVRRAFDRAVQGHRRAFGFVNLSAVFRYFSRCISFGFDNVRRIVEEIGLSAIACGNDAGPCPSTPAGIDLELEMLDLCLSADDNGAPGLPALEALRVVTINSARAMGLETQLGSIEPGKVADLIVIDGDPLTDSSILGQPVAAVFKEGELVINRCDLKVLAAGHDDLEA